MNNYSTKELQTLATRSAKGAYLPWGLAEEAATAVAWLETHSISAIAPFVELLTANDGMNINDLKPVELTAGTVTGSNRRVCPIITGAYMSDLRGTNLSEEAVQVRQVNTPLLLIPFLAAVAGDLGKSIFLKYSDVVALISGDGVEIVSGTEELDISMRQDVTISLASGEPELFGAVTARVDIPSRYLLILQRFALRTYLPESKQSMASGAGGGGVDDD